MKTKFNGLGINVVKKEHSQDALLIIF